MYRRFGHHLRTNLVGYLALAVALSVAPAYAAGKIGPKQLKSDAVRSKHIKNKQVKRKDLRPNAVNGSRVARNSLTGADINEHTLRVNRSRVYRFEDLTFTGGVHRTLDGLTRSQMDRATVTVTYNPESESESAMYPAPGLGPNGNYQVRWFMFDAGIGYAFRLRLVKSDGSARYASPVTYRWLKVVITWPKG